jgi:serine/threonine protein kinase
MADWIGRTLGRVQIESLVARGGMAEVYLGTHTTLQREVAVKILRQVSDEDDTRHLQQFEREARAVAKLRHPNIVQVFDFDTIDGQPYLVMEYIRGPSLSKYLKGLQAKNGRLELPLISRVLTGVANALQFAHESGVVHRDVKPGNILLASRSLQILPGQPLPLDFEPFLTDFGLVRFLNSSRQTTVGQTAGTPAYMSPEQAMGLATDGRTDIYSLGVVLYEMLSGSVPFDGETTMSVLLKHLNVSPLPIPNLSPGLHSVLDKALAKQADDRFQTPKEFAEAFHSALDETTDASTILSMTRAAKPALEKKSASRPQTANKWRPALLAGLLILLVGAALLFSRMVPAANAETPSALPPTNTATQAAFATLGPTGVLRFHDASALLDQAALVTQAMPAPPAGARYEVWLVNGAERLSLGILSVDAEGKGNLVFDEPQKRNLLANYTGVEVTLTSGETSDANGSDRIAYAYTLPEAGLGYLRGLMASFPTAPGEVGLIQGLAENARELEGAAQDMLNAHESSDEAGIRGHAESMLNILVGDQNPDLHKDWNGDGRIADPGDGYGLLLNGDHLGYIQAVYSHADYAVNAAGASRNMVVNGESVKICAQNLAGWAPELRDRLLAILNASAPAEMDVEIRRAAELADQMLNGIDLNENARVEPVAGECGALVAYEATYRMADMPLLPVNPLDTPTPTNGTAVTPLATLGTPVVRTPTNRPGDSVLTAPPAEPTDRIPPGQATRDARPTNEPRPTKEPNDNNGGGGNGGGGGGGNDGGNGGSNGGSNGGNPNNE